MPADARTSLAALLLTAALALTGCSEPAGSEPVGAPPASGVAEEPVAGLSYVALGDSFTAAPFVPVTDDAGGCYRSSGNYPSLVAAELRATLVDVSCSGADTTDIVEPQALPYGDGPAPPQIEAVPPQADLVTIGIGGNDGDLFRTLVHDCTLLTREGFGLTPCQDLLQERYGETDLALEELGARVEATLRALRQAAPRATVALVGYPRLVDADLGCPLIPLSDSDRAAVAELERTLNEVLAGAAEAAGVEYVDMHAASEGHEICSAEPWVNGSESDQDRALAFHPYAEEQRAVAERILELLA